MNNTLILHLRPILKAKQIFLTSFHLLFASFFPFLLLDLGLPVLGLSSCLLIFSVGLKTVDFDSLRLESWVNNPHIFCIVSERLLFLLRDLGRGSFFSRLLKEERRRLRGGSTQVGGCLFLRIPSTGYFSSFSLPFLFLNKCQPLCSGLIRCCFQDWNCVFPRLNNDE